MVAFLSIQADVRAAASALNDAQKKQLPFAIAKALTALAFEVQTAERTDIKQAFKRPRPFTQRGTLVTKATKSLPVASVFLRPEVAAYLAPYEVGGMQRIPGKGKAILKPVDIKLDSYGQIKGAPSTIAALPGVFVGTVKTKAGPVWGFWQRLTGKQGGPRIKLLLRAGNAMNVSPKLGFVDRARAVVAARGRVVFDQELGKALASAR